MINAVIDITCVKNDKGCEKGKIIVYYPQQNDTVWDVAKDYGVNPEMLKMSNGIEGEDLEGVRMIVLNK